MNKNSHVKTRAPKIPNFSQQLIDMILHNFGIKSGSGLDWNILEKSHLQRGTVLKNSRTGTH
jgi:hypothetical protein